IREQADEIDAMLYLWPLENPACIRDATLIAHILQAIDGASLKKCRLLLSGIFTNTLEHAHLDSWIAFERSLGLVMPETQVAVVFREAGKNNTLNSMREWVRTLLA